MKTKSLGFIGGGRITKVILQAIANNKTEYKAIVVYDLSSDVLDALKNQFPGIHLADSASEAVDKFVEEMLLARRCFKPRAFIFPTVLKDQELQRLKVPALYLAGENEKLYSVQKATQRLNRVASHIQTEIIPQAGHELIVVQAKLVNRRILEFLKQP